MVTSSNSSALLTLTISRMVLQAINTGTGQYIEDPSSPSRVRCSAYRTLYVYSPRLQRDICVHAIQKNAWPQTDVTENDENEYHFQIWLAGSRPRQVDTRTALRLSQCQNLLLAMRKDSLTANVEITIRQRSDKELKDSLNHEQQQKTTYDNNDGCYMLQKHSDNSRTQEGDEKDPSPKNATVTTNNMRQGTQPLSASSTSSSSLSPRGTVFLAHKTILESTPFFARMLNGGFREGQRDEHGRHRIELSSDMFDAEIMDILLDHLYTREPIRSDTTTTTVARSLHRNHMCRPAQDPDRRSEKHGSVYQSEQRPPSSPVRHIISANVGLNLQTIINEPCNASTGVSLTLKHWGALYRAGTHLEDKDLQTQAIEQIQAQLDPETALDEVLSWGHYHQEIKSVMMEYLVKKRRVVFGSEEQNRLRPYLWAEYEDQVDTLVEITSKIAQQ
ncbi:hypothetical protein BGZ51_007247 [Haplosporangium sp. Z 767]|nr:hypothetical protein BGZ51_007247 [Haplosporangium sp. Z 767]